MAKKKKPKKINPKRNSLVNRIVSLTVFLDAIFLIVVLGSALFLYYLNQNQMRDRNAAFQNEIVTETITTMIDHITMDTHKLAVDQDIIDYLNYVNTGSPAIPDVSSEDYGVYASYLVQAEAMVNYQESNLYDLVYVATPTNCSLGTDGCGITHEGQLSFANWNLTQRPWYLALSTQDSALVGPYIDGLTGEYVISFTEKVYDNDQLIGYVGIDIRLASMAALFNELRGESLEEDNQVVILSGYPDDTRLLYFSLDETYQSYYMQSSDNFYNIDQLNDYDENGMHSLITRFDFDNTYIDQVFGEEYLVIYSDIEDTNFQTITLFDVQQLLEIEWMFLILIGISSILVALVVLVITGSVRKSLAPIDDILHAIDEITNGNYKAKIKVQRSTELKKIGEAINMMSSEIDKQVVKTYESLAYDVLTGLKNRASASSEVDATIFQSDKRAAVCLIQVDNLKNINVTKGQIIGDNLIKAIAQELKQVFKDEEVLFSNGGNEFIYIKKNIHSLEEVEFALNRLLTHFKQPLVVKNIKAEVKFYIGVSVYPTDGKNFDELIKKCDTALFKATEAGFKKIIFYNEKIARTVSYQAEISEQLSSAIANDQIYLKYQPLVTNDEEIYGFEALARWASPTLGEIGPQVFIANAEESYLIIPIGTWILREACRAQVELRKKFNIEFMMSVNVSPIQILQRDFVDVIKSILKETDINPEYLTLELTESLFIEASILLEDTIEQIHSMGIKLSLDDFGTGYASLTYLRQISFDNLKIDKTFVDGIFASIKDHRIIGTIVSLVHNLDMKVIAEGVEKKKQYEYLKEIYTDIFQGYIFSRPLLLEDAIEYVQKFYDIPKYKRADYFSALNE